MFAICPACPSISTSSTCRFEARDAALPAISKALDAIKADIEAAIPSVTIQATNPKVTDSLRLTVRAGGAQIKIELSPVLRGTVWPAEPRGVVRKVEDIFGYAEIQVVSIRDLYAGKICAALDRQHPRDLFDIKQLFENEGIDRELFKTFLVYLISHGRPWLSYYRRPAKTLPECSRGSSEK